MNPADHKRILLANSDLHRQALALECLSLQGELAWLPRTVSLVRTTSPLLWVAGPILGFVAGLSLFRKKRPVTPVPVARQPRAAWFNYLWKGIQLYRQVHPVIQGIQRTRASRVRTS
jgi:hypothetical protein